MACASPWGQGSPYPFSELRIPCTQLAFRFLGGAGWATGHRLWARQSKKEDSTI